RPLRHGHYTRLPDTHDPPPPVTSCSLQSYAPHRLLPSFPTRRSSDLHFRPAREIGNVAHRDSRFAQQLGGPAKLLREAGIAVREDRKSTRLNSSHLVISYAVFCLKKKKKHVIEHQHHTHAFCDQICTV